MDNSPEHGISYHEEMDPNSKIINIKMELTPKLSGRWAALYRTESNLVWYLAASKSGCRSPEDYLSRSRNTRSVLK